MDDPEELNSSGTVVALAAHDVDNTSSTTERAMWSDVGDNTPAVDLWVPNEMFQ